MSIGNKIASAFSGSYSASVSGQRSVSRQGSFSAQSSSGVGLGGPTETQRGRDKVSRDRSPFGPALKRFTIGSLDNEKLTVSAQYNPSSLEMKRDIAWKQQDNKDNRPGWLSQKIDRDGTKGDIEYTGADKRTLTFDLVFDGYEFYESIESDIRALEEMASVRDPDSSEPMQKRPHVCVVVCGTEGAGSLGRIRCVITSLSVNYSMFSSDGSPTRANVKVSVRETNIMSQSRR